MTRSGLAGSGTATVSAGDLTSAGESCWGSVFFGVGFGEERAEAAQGGLLVDRRAGTVTTRFLPW